MYISPTGGNGRQNAAGGRNPKRAIVLCWQHGQRGAQYHRTGDARDGVLVADAAQQHRGFRILADGHWRGAKTIRTLAVSRRLGRSGLASGVCPQSVPHDEQHMGGACAVPRRKRAQPDAVRPARGAPRGAPRGGRNRLGMLVRRAARRVGLPADDAAVRLPNACSSSSQPLLRRKLPHRLPRTRLRLGPDSPDRRSPPLGHRLVFVRQATRETAEERGRPLREDVGRRPKPGCDAGIGAVSCQRGQRVHQLGNRLVRPHRKHVHTRHAQRWRHRFHHRDHRAFEAP